MPSVNFYSSCKTGFTDNAVFVRQPDNNKEYSYSDLDVESGRIAAHLVGLGLIKGDRVLVQVEKSPQNLFWYFACLRAGLIYLPLNTAYLEQEVEYFVNDAEPSLILCDPSKLSTFQKIAICPVHTLDGSGIYSGDLGHQSHFRDVECAADDIAVILYTSGTTGKPKGAMISHGNLISNGQTLSRAWQWRTDDIMLHILPIFHIHGLFVATHLPVLNSSTIVFLDRFNPDRVIQLLRQATVFMGVPTNYVRLLANPSLNKDVCGQMRLFTSGSAPLLAQTHREFNDRTGHAIVERYGMTETGMNTSNPISGERKPGTVGKPLPGIETAITDSTGQEVGIATPGNLLVRGNNVFKGYWRLPEKTTREFTAEGYFKTGDIAITDSDGYISIIGRDKDMIITGGLNVYPKEIETAIDDMPGISESAVIGLPDSDFGEAVTAVVVISGCEEPTEADVIEYLKSKLAGFKVAKRVHFVPELPRNTMGKVQKNLLREKFGP